MANKKLSELAPAANLADADIFVITKSGVTVKLTAAQMRTYIQTTAFTGLANYANDAAAAAGGIAVGRLYRNGSVVMVRVA